MHRGVHNLGLPDIGGLAFLLANPGVMHGGIICKYLFTYNKFEEYHEIQENCIYEKLEELRGQSKFYGPPLFRFFHQ